MKKPTLIVALTTLMTVFIFIGCHNTKEEKLQDAKENIDQAKQDIQQANGMDSTHSSVTVATTASDAEWTTYRKDVEARIARLNDRIQDLKIKIKKPGVALDNMRQRRIDELQERIAALKAKIGAYKYDANGYVTYKTDLEKELDKLSKDLDEAGK